MKKLSLLSVFVLALVMLFAFSVFADGETTESQAYVINKEHIESVVIVPNCNPETTINGEGSINNLFDGDCYSQTDYGWFPYHPRWIGKDSDNCGSVATITLREECLITSAQVYMWSNNNNLVNFKFYNAKGNETSSTSGPATIMDGSPVDLGGGFKVKTIVIETPAIRSQIWLYELVLNAEPLPPCTHDIDTCMDTFRVLTPATCNSDALIEYTCTECRKVVTASPTYDNIIQYALKSTIATSGAGGDTTSPNALFDGDEDSYLHASTNWFVQSEIAFNMNYYLHSVTVTVGSYSSNGSNGAVMTIWYKAPGATEWTEAGKIDTPIKQANTKYNYTLDFTTPVYASAIKVRIDGLQHSNGQAFEAKVAGSLVAEVGKLNHTWVKGETVAPTCVSVGYTNYSCSACEATKIDDAVAVDIVEGHTGGTATCTAKAVCSLCLKEYGEFGNHTYTNTIACITNKCVVCGYVNADVAAEKPHTYGWNIGTNENGEQMHGCSVCKTEAVRDKDNNNISTNLGFTIFYAQSAKDLTKTGYDVIRLCVDFSYKDTLSIKDPNVLIDFGGHSYTKTGSRFNLQQVKGLVNGTIYQNHGLYAIRVYCAGFIEDFDIVVDASYNDNASGIYMWYDASYGGSSLGYMKNVTIDSVRDDNGNYKEGRGLFNHGIEFSNTNSVIGTLENVKVYSRGQALTLYAKSIGKMTNCTFDGTNIALAIGNLQCNVELENCVVNSEVLAIYIEKASAGTKFEFDEKTTISSSGTAFYILPTGEEYDFSDLTSAVALVDGKLYTSFDAALAALKASTAKTTTFTLIGDLELDAPIEISKAVQFSLGGGKFKVPVINTKNFNEYDAPGYVLTAPNGAFIVKEGGLLTITGDQGTLVGGENAIVVEEGGSALIVAGTYDGFNPQNYMSSDSCYDIKDGKYTITKNHTYSEDLLYGILYRADGDCNSCGYVRGVARVGELYYATLEEAIAAAVAYNATVEEDEDKVSVELAVNIDLEKSLVVSDVVKIVLNGKTISASKDTAGDGVFHVVAGELTISDHTQYFTGTVNGVCASEYDMAIWVEGGKVIIEAGIFTNVGAGDDDQYDLIYVKGGELEIKGGTFLAQTPKWTLNLNDNIPGTITVTGGKFLGYNPTKSESENPVANFVPANKCAVLDNDGYYVVTNHVKSNEWTYDAENDVMVKTCVNCPAVMETTAVVAKINGIGYASLEAAVAVGGEITLEADIDLAKAVVINNNVTINLNGKKLTVKKDTVGDGVFCVVAGGVLTINGEGTVNGVGNNNYNIAIWANGGSVVINGGTYTNVGATDENGDDHFDLIYAKNGGSVVINGGTFIAQTPKWTLNLKDGDGSTIVVNGGSFYAYNPTESTSEGPVVDFTSGKCAVKNSENYYVLGEHQYFNSCDARCEACGKITKEPTHNIVHVTAKAPTCTANGNVEYWYCDICGAAWTDEALTQLTNQKSVIVPATGHSYANDCDKACAVCYEITRPEADHTIVHVDAKAATCTANGNKEYWTCSDCGYAWLDEACTLVANQKSVIVPATGHSYFTQCDPVCMNCYELTNPDAAHKITHVTAVAPTCTENGNIEYWYCEYCNTAWTSEALNTPPMGIKSTTLPATGHTKVEIPAVRPTPSNGNKAYTAGIKCADCNDIIQEVEEITVVQNQNTGFQIYNASLGLSDDITLIYLTYIPEEYRENAYMVFTYRGTEYVVDTKEEKDGIYRFRFSAVTPQYVGENIESVLYSKVNGEYVKTGTINYSVLAFCASWLNYDKTPVKTRTLMSDFLVYAAAAQVATNVNVDKLVTDGFGDKLTPSTFSKLDDSQFVMRLEGTADSRFAWKNVSLTLGSSVAMKFYFTATETENLKIKITINGRTQIIDFADCEYDTTYECYTASFTNITAIEFADEVKAEFMVGEEIVGNSALYTIDSFVYQWQSVTDSKYEKTINLVKALYNYGKSAWNSVH